jgi:DGQHR domain-containing protein
MKISFPVVTVEQPIGIFYLSAVPAAQLLRIVTIRQRTLEDPPGDGVQRTLSTKRIGEIALYTSDPDATFPTPIIVACSSETVSIEGGTIEFDDERILGEVIDGQHRVRGLQIAMASQKEEMPQFTLPVVFMLDLEPYDKAYVFSTINSKQTPVPKSLIYDLFELAQNRSPAKTCHEIARTLNKKPGPFFQGLKMLGKRTAPTEYLTQGSFVTQLLSRISRKPQTDEIDVKLGKVLKDDETLPFRYYWIHDRDEIIVKILENYFTAIQETFPSEWNAPTADAYILRKTVGFVGLLKAFDFIWPRLREEKSANIDAFLRIAQEFRNNLHGRPLTAEEFGSSAAAAGALQKALVGEPSTVS